jgi:hypothetical protein
MLPEDVKRFQTPGGDSMVQTKFLAGVLSTAVALTACSHQSDQSNQSNQVTVNGTVLDKYGHVWPSQPVVISAGTFSRRLVSDASGAFTVENVPTPYNAIVIDATSVAFATVYVGLTRTDPTLTIGNYQLPKLSGNLSGQLMGGSYPESSDYSTAFVFGSPEVTPAFPQGGFVDDSSGAYSGDVYWLGPASTTGTLYALQVHSGGGLPLDYPGYGTLSGIVLENDDGLPNQNVTLAPVTTGSLSATVSVPPDYTFEYQAAAFQPAPGVSFPNFWGAAGGPASFVYATPSIPGTSLMVSALASMDQGPGSPTTFAQKQVPATASSLALSLPAAPSLTVPADGAAGVTLTTPFTWTEFAGGVYAVSLIGQHEGLVVYVAATSATIPDLTAVGFPLLGSYEWQVTGIAPVAGIDALAAAGGTWALSSGDFMEATSGQRSFTTSP